ncbi:MAG: hypothetical protein JJE21_02955 [Spirochaetaceae bacterium]|nr:hypothetical protein [Spirochaetaceae bacterium]
MMMKFFTVAIILTVISLNSIFAIQPSYTIILVASVLDNVEFEATDKGYQVKSNVSYANYTFYDVKGNETDAYRASVFTIVAT